MDVKLHHAFNRHTKGSGARKSTARLANSLNTLKTELSGTAIRVPSDPSSFTAIPWNNVTVSLRGTGSGTVSVGAIVTALKNQIYLGDALAKIEVRIHHVKNWVLSDTADETLEVDYYDFTRYPNGPPSKVETLADTNGKNHFAKVGFQFPSAIAKALPYSDNTLVYGVTVSNEDTVTVDYIYLQWRCASPATARVMTPRKLA